MLDLPPLKSVLPSLVTMKANTAIGFLLSGVSLWLMHEQKAAKLKRRIAQLCSFTVALIGLLTLSQYLFGWNLGIDQLVFRERPGAVGTSHLGRMAPNTALNFLLLGFALLLLSPRVRRYHWLAHFLTLVAALVSLQPLLGYVYGVESLYGITSYTQMALHTALTFIVLCVGILFSRPHWGLMRSVTSSSAGGFIARRLLLAAIAIPSVLGYLILQGYRAGLYNAPFGMSLLVMANSIVFAVWIWQNAQTLDQLDTHRKRAQKALQHSEKRFRRLVESNIFGVGFSNFNGSIHYANDYLLNLVGYTRQEMLASQIHWTQITPPDFIQLDVQAAEELTRQGVCTPFEKELIRKDGKRVPVLMGEALLQEPYDRQQEMIVFCLSLSDRKRIQEALQETNQTLQAIIQACPLAITVFSLDTGQVKLWNPAAEKIFGWNEHETLGRFLPSIPEDKRDEFLANLDMVRQGNTLTGVETRRQRKDGSSIDISVWACPVQDALGHINCMSIVADISDRKHTEAALKESEERFRKLAEKVCVIPWEADAATGQFTYVGPQAQNILGYPSSDWYTDQFWTEHIHPDDREWATNYCLERAIVDDNYEFEYRMVTADGRIVWLYDIVNVVRSDGKPSVLRGFMIDITDRKQAEQEREQLLAREQAARSTAEAANRMKDEFLATLSHELRTPLNAMLGWTRLLCTRKMDEVTTARALETIDRNTKSLAALIEDVLDVSRIIRGKLHLNVAPINLVPAIEAAIDTVRPAAQAKDIQIKSILDPSLGFILGDANRLQQVVWNLLSNAVKFTPRGGRVEVRLSQIKGNEDWGLRTGQSSHSPIPNYAQIQVSDTGKGIAPEFLPYVFERFRQENSSTTRAYGGLGLGLAIVRHLVELHGGIVRADSPGEGLGATFSVQLPLLEGSRRTRERESGKAGESEHSFHPPLTPSLPHSLTGLRVLVVDDEADARELIAAILGEYGAEVTAVASAGEALETLQHFKPNVLVSDIGMPGEDGYALIRNVRTLDAEQGGQIPAVALTAYARAEERILALTAGFQRHVPKPVNPEELAAIVANLVGRTGNN